MPSQIAPTSTSYIMTQDGRLVPMGDTQVYGGGSQSMGQPYANNQANLYAANQWGMNDVARKMANAIDPRTGRILKQPTTQAEYAEVEKQAAQIASDSARSTFQQQAAMLGFGNTGATGGNGSGYDAQGNPTKGGGGSASSAGGGSSSYGPPAIDPAVEGGFKATLLSSLTNPGLDATTVQQMTNRANEPLSVARTETQRQMQQQAAAAGMGTSGTFERANTKLNTDTANQQAGNARDIAIAAAQQRQQLQQQALGTAGQYLNADKARQQAWYMNQAENARSDRNAYIGLLGQQKPLIPSITGGGIGLGAGPQVHGATANDQNSGASNVPKSGGFQPQMNTRPMAGFTPPPPGGDNPPPPQGPAINPPGGGDAFTRTGAERMGPDGQPPKPPGATGADWFNSLFSDLAGQPASSAAARHTSTAPMNNTAMGSTGGTYNKTASGRGPNRRVINPAIISTGGAPATGYATSATMAS